MPENKSSSSEPELVGPEFPDRDEKWGADERVSRLREAAKSVGGNRALASKSQVPLGTLNGYLAGGEPKISALNAIAEASGLSFEWLALGTGPRERSAHQPIAMFASIDMDQLARAMLTARQQFDLRGGSPNWREMAQAVALIYDMITAQETKRVPGEPGP